MTTSIRLELEETHRAPLVAEDAYCLYGWLVEQLPPAYAAYLHEEGERPFCQYLLPSREERHRAVYQWTLFSEDAVQTVAPILLNSTSFPFRSGGKQVCVRRAEKETFRFEEAVERCFTAPALPSSYQLRFLSPTTFKTENQYALFPTAGLVVKSAASRFALLDSGVTLQDEEALRQLVESARITGYSLHTQRYSMKGAVIPGFTGWIRLAIHGPTSMKRLFWLLMCALPLYRRWNQDGAGDGRLYGGRIFPKNRGGFFMEQMNIKSLLRSKQTLLESKLDVLINHPVTKGDHCEGAWIDFFRSFLPSKYAVDKGFVFDSKGAVSEQIDIIIYDALYSPLIFGTDAGEKFITAESVYAVFDSKQKIDKETVEYTNRKIESVVNLHRTSRRNGCRRSGGFHPEPCRPFSAGFWPRHPLVGAQWSLM